MPQQSQPRYDFVRRSLDAQQGLGQPHPGREGEHQAPAGVRLRRQRGLDTGLEKGSGRHLVIGRSGEGKGCRLPFERARPLNAPVALELSLIMLNLLTDPH